MDLEPAKRAAGEAAALLVEDGMTLGLGTGTTARWFIEAVGARVADGLHVSAVATSLASAALAARQRIPLLELDAAGVDLAVDGADTVDPDLRLLKGLGGALVRERIVAAAASRFVIVADESKLRPHLAGFVPVELLVFGWHHTMTLLEQTGATFALRLDAAGEPLAQRQRQPHRRRRVRADRRPRGAGRAARRHPRRGRSRPLPGHGRPGHRGGAGRRVAPHRARAWIVRAPILSAVVTAQSGGGRMAEETLAWRAIKHGHRVLDRDGAEIGTVSRVLADEGADIFHGVAVRHGLPIVGEEREIVAAQIGRIDVDAIHTTLAAAQVDELPPPR